MTAKLKALVGFVFLICKCVTGGFASLLDTGSNSSLGRRKVHDMMKTVTALLAGLLVKPACVS